jgi:hypothetical protein
MHRSQHIRRVSSFRKAVPTTTTNQVLKDVKNYVLRQMWIKCTENLAGRHDPYYRRILFYRKRLIFSVIDRYDAPYFPWAEACFADSEVAQAAEAKAAGAAEDIY